jgi:hypothetical protein
MAEALPGNRQNPISGTTTQWVNRAHYPNHVWSYDFVFDQSEDGRSLKCLTVVDEFTRQGIAIRPARSLTASDVIRVLEQLFQQHGRPACLRSDNVCAAVQRWLKDENPNTRNGPKILGLTITRRLSGVLPPTAGDRQFSCQPIWRTSLHRCCSQMLRPHGRAVSSPTRYRKRLVRLSQRYAIPSTPTPHGITAPRVAHPSRSAFGH